MRPDFVEGFIAYTDNITSPPIFRKWAAIGAVAGALERKVWVRTQGSRVYPNTYIILVGPPGVGKTEVTWRVRAVWEALEEHHVARTSVTKASLIDDLNDAHRRVVHNTPGDPVDNFNSLLLAINELGVLIPGYDNEFMNTLTDLWDCKSYSERRRSSKSEPIEIDNPQLNLIAACTPAYLMNVLPEGAWDQGFLSRTLLIYSGEQQLRSLFADNSPDGSLQDLLQSQMQQIGNLYGEISFTEGAAKLLDTFHLSGGEPKPEHPKLISYTTRRTMHMIKLSMIACISRSDELLIREEDFHRALDWLIEAELYMPDIFKAMTYSGAGKVMEELWFYVYQTYNKEGRKPVLKYRIIQFLQERVPVHTIQQTIEMMEQGNMIEKRLTEGGQAFIPLAKDP